MKYSIIVNAFGKMVVEFIIIGLFVNWSCDAIICMDTF